MSTRYIQKLLRLDQMQNLPNAAGIGVFGGSLYMDFGGGPVPIALAGVGGTSRVVNPDISGANATIQDAIDEAEAGDRILIAPGAYDETITIPRTLSNLSLVGMGGRGSVFIEPSTEDAGGLVCHADDVSMINVGVAGEDETSAIAALITGSRFRAYACKFEGGLTQLAIGPGTVILEAAGTQGVGADGLLEDCEFAWGTNGVVLTASDYGAVTQARFRGCKFHNLTAASFEESLGSGGSADIVFRNLEISDCIFDDLEGGTAPTAFILLNGNNANDGIVANCRFPTAINSGKNLVSTALHWVSNFHTGGLSTAQPS